jgi:predicted PurR-regulated permease PerM
MSADRSSDLARTLFQLLLIGALIAGVFWVLSPFLAALAWAATMVVATWPLLLRVQAALGGRRSLAVAVMTIALLLVLVVPLYAGISTIVGNIDAIAASSKAVLEFAGSPPPSWVEQVPLVGSSLVGFWRELAEAGPTALSERLMPHIKEITSWILGQVGGVGATMIEFLLAVGIASVLYTHGESAAAGLRRFAKRVGGEQTESAVELAGQAVRAVALGVGVTAIVQSSLAGVGLAVAGIPFAGALTALIFVLCVAQLGPGIVLLPAIGWLYWQGQSAWGTALLVFAIPVIALDSFLRPALIKLGADLPILLILPGVIGGLIAFGVIGLFIGPVLLAVGYTLLVAWLADGENAR